MVHSGDSGEEAHTEKREAHGNTNVRYMEYEFKSRLQRMQDVVSKLVSGPANVFHGTSSQMLT